MMTVLRKRLDPATWADLKRIEALADRFARVARIKANIAATPPKPYCYPKGD